MCAVPNMAVFCSSLTSYFPGMFLTFIIIIIIIIIISFMQSIYNYMNSWKQTCYCGVNGFSYTRITIYGYVI